MIGRLIDQLLPTSVHNPEEASTTRRLRRARSHLQYLQEGKYGYRTPWGDTLGLWDEGNVNIVNLETAVTTHEELWPDKVFNYRTHPSNLACLAAARIDHVSLANNHTLDFGIKGLEETCESLDEQNISYVGAGKSRDRALGPVFLDVPLSSSTDQGVTKTPTAVTSSTLRSSALRIALLSASNHPTDWSSVPTFHLLPSRSLSAMKEQLFPLIASARVDADLVIFSVHWGPNYRWVPEEQIQELGRWMVAQGVDIVHGHSSHHVQGVEVIQLKSDLAGRGNGLIIYGCGDFVDDYAVNLGFRNDLSALWRVNVAVSRSSAQSDATSGERRMARLHSLSIFPTRCSSFQVNRLDPNDPDWKWVKTKIIDLSPVQRRDWVNGRDGSFGLTIG